MKNRSLYSIFHVVTVLVIMFTLFCSCDDGDDYIKWPAGVYSKSQINKLNGFSEQRNNLLSNSGLSFSDYVSLSTDSAWSLNDFEKNKLLELRNAVNFPDKNTIIEKVIPLQDVATYMNNVYGGTIGGFVSVAADIKDLSTMNDVYNGLRLDYKGSKFLVDGAGYSVVRFTSSFTDHLYIPFCYELGGTNPHSWPNTGGGFTSSTLGEGGYPEYCFDNYYIPDQGSEIYEVTPLGNEILRARFEGNKWITVEPEDKKALLWINPVRNGLYGKENNDLYPLMFTKEGDVNIVLSTNEKRNYNDDPYYVTTYGQYNGDLMRVWGFDENHYLITTSDFNLYEKLNLDIIEKGIFGKIVFLNDIKNIHEEIVLR